ncbi:MAG: FHA domain-containing protein [Planctomycetota bacterium]
MASIIIMSGAKNDYCRLGQGSAVIGRDEALPLQILDEYVSRKHLQICFDTKRGRYYVLDMQSKHGVFINDRKINEKTFLMDGDQIRIGDTTILFTNENFTSRESALSHLKKIGEGMRPTAID